MGTTKPTIQSIRDRTHWNAPNLVPQDPVTLGLCSQTDLDAEVEKAAKRLERERKQEQTEPGGTLLPVSETVQPSDTLQGETETEREETPQEEEARMLAKPEHGQVGSARGGRRGSETEPAGAEDSNN